MGKRVKLELNGKTYVAEWDRQQFSKMEKAGYSVQLGMEQPLNYSFGIFKFSLQKNQPSLSDNQVNDLFDVFVKEYSLTEYNEWANTEYLDFFNPIQPDTSKKKSLDFE